MGRCFPFKEQPMVSVLIPARNEEKNIAQCLQSLMVQDYPAMEILVLDDDSSDRTACEIQTLIRRDQRIRYIRGRPLPPGWTGKNWACAQLAEAAAGNYFIFTDADNRPALDAVTKTAGWMLCWHLDLFTSFPQQDLITLAEKLVVPSVYMTVYSYLPLWLTCLTPFPSMAAANGQWLAFKREAYQKMGGHESVRDKVVEDTELARRAKRMHLRILTTPGTGLIFGRMYRNWKEVWNGFSKNLYGLTGYHAMAFISLLFIMFLAYILPYVLLVIPELAAPAGLAVGFNLMIRTILSLKYKDPWITVLLHPVAILLTILIGIHSMLIHGKDTLVWKGRKISLKT
jgi:chlorobactene glucosyltransferase